MCVEFHDGKSGGNDAPRVASAKGLETTYPEERILPVAH